MPGARNKLVFTAVAAVATHLVVGLTREHLADGQGKGGAGGRRAQQGKGYSG